MSVLNEDSIDFPLVIALPSGQSNGVPNARRFENTGEVETAVEAAINSEENTVEALAKLILTSRPSNDGGDGSGSDAGAKVLKDIKRHKWLAVLMTLVIGPGSMTATYYAIKDRGISNETRVQAIEKNMAEDDKQEILDAKEFALVKEDIGKIQGSVKALEGTNTEMLNGIKSLQQVHVTRLERENIKLERQLARERERSSR